MIICAGLLTAMEQPPHSVGMGPEPLRIARFNLPLEMEVGFQSIPVLTIPIAAVILSSSNLMAHPALTHHSFFLQRLAFQHFITYENWL